MWKGKFFVHVRGREKREWSKYENNEHTKIRSKNAIFYICRSLICFFFSFVCCRNIENLRLIACIFIYMIYFVAFVYRKSSYKFLFSTNEKLTSKSVHSDWLSTNKLKTKLQIHLKIVQKWLLINKKISRKQKNLSKRRRREKKTTEKREIKQIQNTKTFSNEVCFKVHTWMQRKRRMNGHERSKHWTNKK